MNRDPSLTVADFFDPTPKHTEGIGQLILRDLEYLNEVSHQGPLLDGLA